MLRNQRFFLDRIDSRLAHVESHISCDSDDGDQMDTPGSNSRVLENIFVFGKQTMSMDGGWCSMVVSGGSRFVLCMVVVILLMCELCLLRLVATLCFM